MHLHFTLEELVQLWVHEDGVHCSATRNRRQEGDITERGWKRSDCLSLDRISRRYLIRRAGRKGFAVLWSLQSRIRCKSTLYNPFGG